MKKKTLKTKQGFTIIEVVLVLAIAGLIFLMVFVAFPALQKNQRDTQRRQDYADLSAAIITFATNSNGNFPTTDSAKTTLQANMGKGGDAANGTAGKDPEGVDYKIEKLQVMSPGTDTGTLNKGEIRVYQKATCGTNGDTPTSGGTEKQFVIYAYLEGGKYCLEGKF